MAAGALALAVAGAAMSAGAQVIERHLPPIPAAPLAAEPTPAAPEADDTPIGPMLRGIVLLGQDDPVLAAPHPAIDTSRAAPPEAARIARRLGRFLGRPLSRRLIDEVIAAVTRGYRAQGHALVSVVTPEQELTGGVLQLRVVSFRVGQVTVSGTAGDARRVRARVRLRPGEQPSSAALAQDLDWLNRYPFIRVDAVLAPGGRPGETDVALAVQRTKPWQAYSGIAPSDAPSTGDQRVFAGLVVGGVPAWDGLLSVQGTSSALSTGPAYASLSARVQQPLAPRRQLELSFDAVRTRRRIDPFSVAGHTLEGALGLRFALPPAWRADGRIGIEVRRQETNLRFGGIPAFRSAYEIYQLYLGAAGSASGAGGRTSWDVSVHVSPGGVTRANSADRLFAGRQATGPARYGYASASLSHEARIARRLVWRSEALAQIAAAPLPGTEQAALGGSALVRGYTFDDGAFDRVLIVRNELLPAGAVEQRTQLLPYAFADAGVAGALHGDPGGQAAAVGAGLTARVFGAVDMKLDVALALLRLGRTQAGSALASWRISAHF